MRLRIDTSRLRGAVMVLALSLTATGALAQADLGDPAPDFTLLGNDGTSYTLSDVYGDQVQLLFMVGFA